MISRERWQRIKDLFNAALERPASERRQFLEEACAGDESMREEVESLISAHEEDEEFLGGPAYEMGAELLAHDHQEFAAGQKLGPYTILATLGTGGMGEVYLAQDARLGRNVAVKLLAQEFARDEQRVRRFEQEARAVSALNHPNVCVIHEVGQADDGRHFMAMEFIDGMTLRRRMSQKPLSLKEALDVAAQVAWALEAAHTAGIIHRDIKPENIMLRRDGYVKVLDFGIAKLSSSQPRLKDPHEASTAAPLHTTPGTLMGTVKYMSPEQLRERTIDARTDIWSLGVVLHEMVTGVTPFEAPTTNDTIAVILEKQPPRFDFYPDKVPAEFRQLIARALSKKRGERYRTIRELASDLRQLRQRMSAEPDKGRSERPTLNLDLASDSQELVKGTGDATILSRIKSGALWTADYVLSEIQQHKTAAIFTGASAVFALLFLGLNVPGLFNRRQQPSTSTSPPVINMTPLTNNGKAVCAAISHDGKLVAWAQEKDGKQELLITNRVSKAVDPVVAPIDAEYRSITFSPDDNYLNFTRAEKDNAVILYQLALPRSAPRRIKEGVDSPISFSSTGDRFSFVRLNRAKNEYSLMIAGSDGAGERALATRGKGEKFSVYGPGWSPDDKTVVCGAGWWDHGYHMNLMEVDVEHGTQKPIGTGQWYFVFQVAWLQDKSALVISAKEKPLSPIQLWKISYPGGERTRITSDISEYANLSVTNDGHSIAAVQSQQHSQIWIAPEGDARGSAQIASLTGRTYGLGWTNKRKVVFSSMAGSHLDIRMVNADGSSPTQLTANAGDNYTPAVSPDGRFIVFSSNRTGGFNIWRVNAEDGSDPVQLTFGDSDSYPSVTADGQWVLYDNQSEASYHAWKVSINGGSPVQLTDYYARMPMASPDGQFIACRYDLEGGEKGIAILPFQGGTPVKRLAIPIMEWQRVQWISNGRALAYIKKVDGAYNIWTYPLDGGPPKQLTNFQADRIFAFDWSPDEKDLACEVGTHIRDVTIITIEN